MSSGTFKTQALNPARDLRDAFGQFATGVTIVSAPALPDTDSGFAITVNSFASVSLQPPLISWCIQKDSTSYPLWMDASNFAVSILNAHQGELCRHFAIRDNHLIHKHQAFTVSALGNPVVKQALAIFDCRVRAVHDAGDHSLILADVLNFDSSDTHAPLVYHRGQF
ncbi:MAG: flavin reductase family protein [Pseudomonadota bacterium]